MNKKIILLVMIFIPFLTNAQLVFNAQLPPAGLVQKDQLWNLILVNNKDDIMDVRIQMSLQDAATGQVVLSASTGNIFLNKGVKVLGSKDLQPIYYNYNIPDVSGNYLPMGSYTACFQVSNNVGEERPLIQECIRFNIDPLSPPLLNTPADKEEIETTYPQFTWMPPSPFEMFTNLTYELVITEVLQEQSTSEAIQYNTPVYTKNNILQPFENYASSFAKLDTGKIYAWQVVARNGLSYAAKTEIWTFKITSRKEAQFILNNNYVLLENNVKGTYLVSDNTLHVKYYSSEPVHETNIIFSNEKGKEVLKNKEKIKQGDNFFDFKLNHKFHSGELYTITITDGSNRSHNLRFSISKN